MITYIYIFAYDHMYIYILTRLLFIYIYPVIITYYYIFLCIVIYYYSKYLRSRGFRMSPWDPWSRSCQDAAMDFFQDGEATGPADSYWAEARHVAGSPSNG